MGLFTFNFNTYHSDGKQVQQEPERHPTEKSENYAFIFEVLVGVGLSYWIDPYMNVVKATLTQILEILTVSPEHAPTYAALMCFGMVCAAPAIIRRKLRKFVK